MLLPAKTTDNKFISKIKFVVSLALFAAYRFAVFVIPILTFNQTKSLNPSWRLLKDSSLNCIMQRKRSFPIDVGTFPRKITVIQVLWRSSDGRCYELFGLIHPKTKYFDLSTCSFGILELVLQKCCEKLKLRICKIGSPEVHDINSHTANTVIK